MKKTSNLKIKEKIHQYDIKSIVSIIDKTFDDSEPNSPHKYLSDVIKYHVKNCGTYCDLIKQCEITDWLTTHYNYVTPLFPPSQDDIDLINNDTSKCLVCLTELSDGLKGVTIKYQKEKCKTDYEVHKYGKIKRISDDYQLNNFIRNKFKKLFDNSKYITPVRVNFTTKHGKTYPVEHLYLSIWWAARNAKEIEISKNKADKKELVKLEKWNESPNTKNDISDYISSVECNAYKNNEYKSLHLDLAGKRPEGQAEDTVYACAESSVQPFKDHCTTVKNTCYRKKTPLDNKQMLRCLYKTCEEEINRKIRDPKCERWFCYMYGVAVDDDYSDMETVENADPMFKKAINIWWDDFIIKKSEVDKQIGI